MRARQALKTQRQVFTLRSLTVAGQSLTDLAAAVAVAAAGAPA
ncbi:MAG TPA: hypothetical protein VL994_12135 [Steroidobacteraceae bacterium]|nr:hypothetical protein [Steroidobacteraceae bacterium]